ncbi:MAG: FAD-dependent thymidylate synthase [Bacillota bacterium]
MRVKPTARLVDYTDDPERNVALAARLCYSNKSPQKLQEDLSQDEIEKLVRKIIDLGHFSTLEHTYFYFAVECSRVTSHQLVRQRIGTSYSQRSQRYVNEEEFDYIIPPKIANNEKTKKLFEEKMEELRLSYKKLLEEGIPREDARFILPTIKTNLMVSYNARSLIHFIKLRTCNRAQWEIRSIGRQMLTAVKKVAPVLFENVGPPCVMEGKCPEGELSCGRIERLQEKGDN